MQNGLLYTAGCNKMLNARKMVVSDWVQVRNSFINMEHQNKLGIIREKCDVTCERSSNSLITDNRIEVEDHLCLT
jgi:hypothetical protein